MPDDSTRLVTNPARRDADKKVREAKESIERAEAEEGRSSIEGHRFEAEVAEAFAAFFGAASAATSGESLTTAFTAIFGAAGAIGRAVGTELERRGVRFRVVGRSPAAGMAGNSSASIPRSVVSK